MARDSGRYDATTDTWIDDNVRIDFAWGNIPMQPNDDRGESPLDPELDSHIIATSGYEGFPAFITGEPFDDTVPNAVMPDIVGMTQVQAEAALAAAGFTSWNNSTVTSGANSSNDGTVASQYPGVGTVLNVTDQPQAAYYDQPMALVPNLSGMAWAAANSAINNAGFIVGSNPTDVNTDNMTIANTVAYQSPAAGTYAAQGSAIDYHLYNYVAPANTGPISGFNGNKSSVSMSWGSYMDGYVMYLQGRTLKPTVGSSIVITGSSEAGYNKTWTVQEVADYDGYDTGGTAVLIRGNSVMNSNATGGTWTAV